MHNLHFFLFFSFCVKGFFLFMNSHFFDALTSPGVYGCFGLPRSGKTTLDAAIAAFNLKRRIKFYSLPLKRRARWRSKNPFFDVVYCTDETVQNCITVSYEELGTFRPVENSLFILSECGIGFNSRNWKSLQHSALHWMKLIGHNRSSIFWESQTADIEKSLRVLTSHMWYIEKSLGSSSILRPISYQFGVDNDSGELRDCYHTPAGLHECLSALLSREIWWLHRRRYYQYFNSYVDSFPYSRKKPPAGTSFENVFARLSG